MAEQVKKCIHQSEAWRRAEDQRRADCELAFDVGVVYNTIYQGR